MSATAPHAKEGAQGYAATDPFKESMTAETKKIATDLQQWLGQRVVAYSTGVRSPKAVARWTKGEGLHPGTERRLRALYRAALILNGAYGPETVRAWLAGANPDLGDTTPIEALREGRDVDVFHAAERFTK